MCIISVVVELKAKIKGDKTKTMLCRIACEQILKQIFQVPAK